MSNVTVDKMIAECYEEGLTNTNKVGEYVLQDITALMIQETPTKYLPFIENYDKNRDLMMMLSKWMETEDEEIGYNILDKLRNLAITAYEPKIEELLQEYSSREEKAQQESRREYAAQVYADNRQRI